MASTRDRLIAATNESFRHRGYHGTSIQTIVETANATIGSLYHFFPGGKSELAEATVRETGRAYGELFAMFLADSASTPEAVISFFDGAADMLVESGFLDVCPIGTVAREVASDHEGLRTATADVFGEWVDSLATPLAAVGIDTDVARDVSATVICVLEGAFVLARTCRDPSVLRTSGRFAASLVDDAFQAVTTRSAAPAE